MSILCLPQDVLERILLMLPVETLLRLKFVNKLCLLYISSSDFVRTQLKHSAILSNSGVIVTSEILPGAGVSIERISIQQFLQQPSIDSHSTAIDVLQRHSFDCRAIDFYGSTGGTLFQNGLSPVSLCNSPDNVAVVGSCNGLICTFTKEYNECRLWNPCIRKSKLLCCLESDVKASSYEVIGFGYDERHNDYKVVASCSFQERNAYVSKAKVFSLKRNSWRRITGFAGWVLDGDTSQFASGKIYWFANLHCHHISSSKRNKRLVSFDLENEEFEIVDPPPKYYDDPFEKSLSALDGRLCVLCCDHKQNRARDLWVMNDGLSKSWTKLVSISGTIIRELRLVKELRLCYMLPNGEIVFDDRKSFLVYNPEHNDLRRMQFHKSSDVGTQRKILPIIHVETLVSPRALL